MHDHDKISEDIVYIGSSQVTEIPAAEYSIYIRYQGANFREVFRKIIEESEFSLPMDNIEMDLDCIMGVFEDEILPHLQAKHSEVKFDILESIFYRSESDTNQIPIR